MAMASGFMCYIKQDDIEKGVICSQYIHNVWNEDLTSHNITLVFDIASDLPMRYLAFAITANSWEWEVLYVHDRQGASTTASVTIPEHYLGTVKLGIKLYDTPPTVGSVMHVGYDYVITGGIDLVSEDGTEEITISCGTEGADIRYTTDDSEPTESSNQYTGTLSVTAPAIIKARAYKDGLLPSDIVELVIEEEPEPTADILGYGSDTVGYNGDEIGYPIEV